MADRGEQRLPQAVELILEVPRYGRLSRLVRLPDPPSQQSQVALPGAEGVPGSPDEARRLALYLAIRLPLRLARLRFKEGVLRLLGRS